MESAGKLWWKGENEGTSCTGREAVHMRLTFYCHRSRERKRGKELEEKEREKRERAIEREREREMKAAVRGKANNASAMKGD